MCDDQNACTVDSCDPVLGCIHDATAVDCDDQDICTDDSCDPSLGCVHVPTSGAYPECTPACRITAGGSTYIDGCGLLSEPCVVTDPNIMAVGEHVTFGGRVSVPYGYVGCNHPAGLIDGQWTHLRHRRRGSFHAVASGSLVCGCHEDSEQFPRMDGHLCNVGDPGTPPEGILPPANVACWSGVGDYTRRTGRRTIRVAFRMEVEDRGEPGSGPTAPPYGDQYTFRMWIPGPNEDVDVLAGQACCTELVPHIRHADVIDGGSVVRGNVHIDSPGDGSNNP